MSEQFRVDLPRVRELWMWLMVAQAVVVDGVSAVILFSGYRPGPIAAWDFLESVAVNAGAALMVGWLPSRLIEESHPASDDALLAFALGVASPPAGLLAWAVTTLMFREFISGWTHPLTVLVSGPLVLSATTFVSGLLLIVILFYAAGLLCRLAKGLRS